MSKALIIILGIITIVLVGWAGLTYFQKPSEIGKSQNTNSSGSVGAGQSTNSGTRQEGSIPQGSDGVDLCGGTGGNGQIVSIGNTSFVMDVTHGKNNGGNLIVHLSSGATIKTSAGSVSLSELKIGDRVTLVGGPNSDGSFTADTIVVCSATSSGTQSR